MNYIWTYLAVGIIVVTVMSTIENRGPNGALAEWRRKWRRLKLLFAFKTLLRIMFWPLIIVRFLSQGSPIGALGLALLAIGAYAAVIVLTRSVEVIYPVSITREIGATAGFTVTLSNGRTFECSRFISASEISCIDEAAE